MTTKKKSIAVKKVTVKSKTVSKKAKVMSGVEIARLQAVNDPRLWDTDDANIPVDHFLALQKANQYVMDFNTEKGAISKKAFMQPGNIPKEWILKLLNMPKVKYMRYYFGLTKKGKIQIVFVGADENHNDVYIKRSMVAQLTTKFNQTTKTAAKSSGDEPGAIDMAQGCPAYGSAETVMLPA